MTSLRPAEPFRIQIPDLALDDLRARLERTRWVPDFANAGWQYGVQGEYLHELLDYWLHRYDWRAQEAAMNAFPHYRTSIDGIPIHFIHLRGNGPAPLPLMLNHGWPWTFWDHERMIRPLADPAAFGGDPRDAFDVIVPSLPGFVFSSPLRTPGIGYRETAGLWVTLMRDVLGYPEEAALFDQRDTVGKNLTHLWVHTLEPQTLAWAMHDSPVGLAAWMLQRRRAWSDCAGDVERCFSKDQLLTHFSLYWLTGSFATSLRYYTASRFLAGVPIAHDRSPPLQAPTAIAVFPRELVHVPRAAAARYADLRQWTVMPRGGHFAPSEQPDLLVEDLRRFYRSLR